MSQQPKKDNPSIEPVMSIGDALHEAVGSRLDSLVELMEQLDRAGDNPSDRDVHHVRVATRRAGTAIAAFAGCLRRGRVKKMNRRLRRIRRAAGNVRRCDVLMDLYKERRGGLAGGDAAALDYAVEGLERERETALEGIAKACRGKARKKLARVGKRLLRNAPVDEAGDITTAGEVAEREIPRLFNAMRATSATDLGVYDNLHELRIEGKRLRYAIEIFRDCFDEADVERAHGLIVGIQDRLGVINDMHDAMDWLEQSWRRAASESLPTPIVSSGETGGAATLHDGLASLAVRFRSERDAARTSFIRWWGTIAEPELSTAVSKLLGDGPNGRGDIAGGIEPVVVVDGAAASHEYHGAVQGLRA
ncbi:MAG TPA: CHAD domain-containing protein [Phycisphaerales bacterium]|nr:CHAD domain-containing protein [Phycisphaerales bacterium]